MNKLAVLIFIVHLWPSIVSNGVWSEWKETGPCHAKCGMGTKTFKRSCTSGQCTGKATKKVNCFSGKLCGRSGGWSAWNDETECSRQCGYGEKVQKRKCDSPSPAKDGEYCTGKHLRAEACMKRKCDDIYGPWSSFSLCSASCGSATKRRSRGCNVKSLCTLPLEEIVECANTPCPVEAVWTEFTDGDCNVKCGRGTRKRTRSCTIPGQCGNGIKSETVTCFGPPCDGGFGPWSHYGHCSVSCGRGTRIRKRLCTNPVAVDGGKHCVGPMIEAKECFPQSCSTDAKWSEWSEFGKCKVEVTQSTGVLLKKRERTCIVPKKVNAMCKGSAEETRWCSDIARPINGHFTQWTVFSPCSATCENGIRMYTRSCTRPPPSYGGKQCTGPTTKFEKCNTGGPCPDWHWWPWEEWSHCSAKEACDTGTRTRTRLCDVNKNNPCPGKSQEVHKCQAKCVKITHVIESGMEYGKFHNSPEIKQNLNEFLIRRESQKKGSGVFLSVIIVLAPTLIIAGLYARAYQYKKNNPGTAIVKKSNLSFDSDFEERENATPSKNKRSKYFPDKRWPLLKENVRSMGRKVRFQISNAKRRLSSVIPSQLKDAFSSTIEKAIWQISKAKNKYWYRQSLNAVPTETFKQLHDDNKPGNRIVENTSAAAELTTNSKKYTLGGDNPKNVVKHKVESTRAKDKHQNKNITHPSNKEITGHEKKIPGEVYNREEIDQPVRRTKTRRKKEGSHDESANERFGQKGNRFPNTQVGRIVALIEDTQKTTIDQSYSEGATGRAEEETADKVKQEVDEVTDLLQQSLTLLQNVTSATEMVGLSK